jgi:ABC-type oligopeptide transport system substrate-binding subunit
MDEIGVFEVIYFIPDSEGVNTEFVLTIEIIAAVVIINISPEVIGSEDTTYEVGSSEPDWALLVTATDTEDGVITVDETMINSSFVDMSVVGEFEVIYTISDSGLVTTVFALIIQIVDTTAPLFNVENQIIPVGSTSIDWTNYIYDISDNSSDNLVLTEEQNNIDYNTLGTYQVTVNVSDELGNNSSQSFNVEVVDVITGYPTGLYNYKFASYELRLSFMAAAEKYLMNNLAGGIPIFGDAKYILYSSRLQLPLDKHLPMVGFGERFATMTSDDSSVLMFDGDLGNVGEFTYRTSSPYNPVTFNQWKYDTSTDKTFMEEYLGNLYDYGINDNKNGYDIIPVMAEGMPSPVNETISDYGVLVSHTWNIPVKDGLEWSYFNNGDAPSYVTDNYITAEDFIDTYKLALDEEWFRAISGGGDFICSTQAIEGVSDYLDGTGTWEDVGIKLIDGQIQFTFVNEMAKGDITYWLMQSNVTPIHIEMYNEIGETYGTSPETIAYHGPYVITEYIEDSLLALEKNPNYAELDLDFFTHKTFQIIENSEILFITFEVGKLEAVGLPTSKFEEYKDAPTLKEIPGSTIYRININGFGTIENERERFPESTWTPEPILANEDFKRAMFFAIDRWYLAEDVYSIRYPSIFLFSDAYLVDYQTGIPYRYTEQGLSVGEGLAPATLGFNFSAAQAFYSIAIQAEIAAGNYTAGTADNWTEIIIDFYYLSDSDEQVAMFEYIELAFETAFIDSENFIRVDIVGYPKAFPDIYYDHMLLAEFDLAIGGISGSTLDASSFLDTYSSDNRSGFTLNWGIDTSEANILVEYIDSDGIMHQEYWSFDAISSVLNGEVYVFEGKEAEAPPGEVTPIT